MGRVRRSLLVWLAVLIFLAAFRTGAAGAERQEDKARHPAMPDFAKLQHGLTPEQVRQRVGEPRRIARQILYHRYLEQWFYDTPVPVRLTFTCPRGQPPQLLSWHGLPQGAEPRR
jgi:hypothetical protein